MIARELRQNTHNWLRVGVRDSPPYLLSLEPDFGLMVKLNNHNSLKKIKTNVPTSWNPLDWLDCLPLPHSGLGHFSQIKNFHPGLLIWHKSYCSDYDMKLDSVHHTCYYLGPWGLLQPTILIMHAWDTLDTTYSLLMGLPTPILTIHFFC